MLDLDPCSVAVINLEELDRQPGCTPAPAQVRTEFQSKIWAPLASLGRCGTEEVVSTSMTSPGICCLKYHSSIIGGVCECVCARAHARAFGLQSYKWLKLLAETNCANAFQQLFSDDATGLPNTMTNCESCGLAGGERYSNKPGVLRHSTAIPNA